MTFDEYINQTFGKTVNTFALGDMKDCWEASTHNSAPIFDDGHLPHRPEDEQQ